LRVLTVAWHRDRIATGCAAAPRLLLSLSLDALAETYTIGGRPREQHGFSRGFDARL
jgi:hypothetical protein